MEISEPAPENQPPKASIKAEQFLPLISYCVVMELKKYNIPLLNDQINSPQTNSINSNPQLNSDNSTSTCKSKHEFLDKLQNLNVEEQLSKIVEAQRNLQEQTSNDNSALIKDLVELKSKFRDEFAQLSTKLQQVITDNTSRRSQMFDDISSFKNETTALMAKKFHEISQESLLLREHVTEKTDSISELHRQVVSYSEENDRLLKEIQELKQTQQQLRLDLQSCEEYQEVYAANAKELQDAFTIKENSMRNENEKLMRELEHVQEMQEKLNTDMVFLREAYDKSLMDQKEIIANLETQFAKDGEEVQKSLEIISTEYLQLKQVQDQIIHEEVEIHKTIEEMTSIQTDLQEAHCKLLSAHMQIDCSQQQLLKDNAQMKENEDRILSIHNQTRDDLLARLQTNQDIISTERGLTKAALDQVKDGLKISNIKCYDKFAKVKEEHSKLKSEQEKLEKETKTIMTEHTQLSKLWEKCASAQQKLTEENLKMINESLKATSDLENLKLIQEKLSAGHIEIVERFGQVNQDIQNIWKQLEENGQIDTSISSTMEESDSHIPRSIPVSEEIDTGIITIDTEEEGIAEVEGTNSVCETPDTIITETLRPSDDPEFLSAMSLYDVIEDDYCEDEVADTSPKKEINSNSDTNLAGSSMQSTDQPSSEVKGRTFSLDPEFYCMVVDSDGNDNEADDPLGTVVTTIEEIEEKSDSLRPDSESHPKSPPVKDAMEIEKSKPIISVIPDCRVVVTRSEKISNLAKAQAAEMAKNARIKRLPCTGKRKSQP